MFSLQPSEWFFPYLSPYALRFTHLASAAEGMRARVRGNVISEGDRDHSGGRAFLYLW